jgi:hypothetical protein
MAIAAIKAAMTKVTVANNKMRFILTSSPSLPISW